MGMPKILFVRKVKLLCTLGLGVAILALPIIFIALTNRKYSMKTYLTQWKRPECPKFKPSTNLLDKGAYNGSLDLDDLITWMQFGKGGRWKQPGFWVPNCDYKSTVALVVPYRDREPHKIRFLAHMHPFLQRQNVAYQIFIIDQKDNYTFNRGKLMNVGYMQAKFMHNFSCYIFHDIDLMPINDNMRYNCSRKGPIHMASAQDRFKWKLPYPGYCGGVMGLTDKQMMRTNGFSNQYWGWGAEDNDFGIRIRLSNQSLQRAPNDVSRYVSMSHSRDKTNPVNPERYKILKKVKSNWHLDGFNDLHYEILENRPTFLYYYLAVGLKREKDEKVKDMLY